MLRLNWRKILVDYADPSVIGDASRFTIRLLEMTGQQVARNYSITEREVKYYFNDRQGLLTFICSRHRCRMLPESSPC